MASRAHPHITIPPGAASSSNPSPTASWSAYDFESPSADGPVNIWADNYYPKRSGPNNTLPDNFPRISLHVPSRPPSRAASAYEQETGRISFPEPQLYRSSSQRASARPSPTSVHRPTKSELTISGTLSDRESRPPSRVESVNSSPEVCIDIPLWHQESYESGAACA